MYKRGGVFVQYGMIVAKFGGTAVTPRNLIYIKRIVTEAHRAVVVSAAGKEFKEDEKVTDLLLKFYDERDERLWQKVASKYRRLVEVNGISVDAEALLTDARARALRFDRQYCASLGEEISARIVSAFLCADYVEAEKVIRFDEKGELLVEQTYDAIRAAFDGDNRRVMGGFYGGCSAGGRRTFSRGGGDVTGAIVAAALCATLYENWTDVNGVCVANPAKVHNVATVSGMSYAEMRLLSLAGAEVLHSDAVAPCEQRAVPIRIGNFFNPDGASTLISHCPSQDKLLSVAEKAVEGGYVVTVLHSFPLWQITRLMSIFFKQNTRELHFFDKSCSVDPDVAQVELSDRVVRVFSRRSLLNALYLHLSCRSGSP